MSLYENEDRIHQARNEIINWAAWQNTAESYRLSYAGKIVDSDDKPINEGAAHKTEKILLDLKVHNEKAYKAIVVYYQQRKYKFVKDIAKMLGVCSNTLRSRLKYALKYLAEKLA